MACTYTGTINTSEVGFLASNSGTFGIIFTTINTDTLVELPLTNSFIFDTSKTIPQLQSDIDSATLSGNVITLVSIDNTGSVFNFNVTNPCPSQNLQVHLNGEEEDIFNDLTGVCSCNPKNSCTYAGTLTFADVTPDSGTGVLTVTGITNDITFDTSAILSTLQANVFAGVIDKNNNNVFIVSFDGDGLVLGFTLIKPCPSQSVTVDATYLAPDGFTITPNTNINIVKTTAPPGQTNTASSLLNTSLVAGDTYIAKFHANVTLGEITVQMTYGSSLDTGAIPIGFFPAPPISQDFEFPFVVLPGDENATISVTVKTFGASNTARVFQVAVAPTQEFTAETTAVSECNCSTKKKKRKVVGYLPPSMCCTYPDRNGNCLNVIIDKNVTYLFAGKNLSGKCCYIKIR